jgi:CO/xanthine dehydrogenase Mo-binding subunit
MAVVKVENATGLVKVEDMYIFQDVGKAINPDIIRGQLEGSCIQGLGYAVTESFDMYKGCPPPPIFPR